jgi:hypothetical protein
MNKELPLESFLDLTLTQHPCDEELEIRKVCVHFEVESPRAWYYHIFLNFHTLVISLQVDPASSDEPETICEGCYETKDTFVFTWSLVPSVGHYPWLCGLIC